MVILKFLFIVFVVFYLIILLGRLYLRHIVKKSKERFQQEGNANHTNNKKNKKDGSTHIQYQPKEKKNIPKDEGEYIDYEEIK